MAGNTAAAGDNVMSEVAEGPAEGSRVWLVTSVAGSKNVGRTVGAGTEMQKGGEEGDGDGGTLMSEAETEHVEEKEETEERGESTGVGEVAEM